MELDSEERQGSKKSNKRYVRVIFDKEDELKKREDGVTNTCSSIDMICLVGQRLNENGRLLDAIASLGITVCHSDDGQVFEEEMPEECSLAFVFDDFSGSVFDSLWESKRRILGPPYIILCAEKKLPLPSVTRPAYCQVMRDLNICFTGFKSRDELSALCWLVHSMGGSVKRDFNSKVTQLVAKNVSGPKYRVAVALGLPIMTGEWIHKCWERRDDISFTATDEEMECYKQVPFYKCCLCFHDFDDVERQHMEEIAASNGAICVSENHEACTHVIVASDSSTVSMYSPRVRVVKQEWFWESVALAACADESLYLLSKEQSEPAYGVKQRLKSHHPGSGELKGSRKRRTADFMTSDRDNSELNYTSDVLNSLLDASVGSAASPAKRVKDEKLSSSEGKSSIQQDETVMTKEGKQENARKLIATELLQTERNYVTILDVIITVFKEPLEKSASRNAAILPAEEIRAIFSSFPDIMKIHACLMESLTQEIETWSSQTDIGKVILNHTDDLVRIYPRFVNFFEMTKEKIHQCERLYPRFHAFLKWNIAKPQCNRQTLPELMITPIQRIPRLVLLLQEMLKHTPDGHQQKESLENAVRQLKTVVSHINEDKRRMEGQIMLFDILRDVDGCPANLLSAQRSLVFRLDLFEITDNLSHRGEPVTMFLLSDSIEIAKRRASWMPSPKKSSNHKAYRHVEFFLLSHIKAIFDINDSTGSSQMFGFMIGSSTELIEKVMIFRIPSPTSESETTMTKDHILTSIRECIARTTCNVQNELVVQSVSGEQLSSLLPRVSHTKSEHHGTLTRALRGAKHKAKKVQRAFSHHVTKSPKLMESATSLENVSASTSRAEGTELTCSHSTPKKVIKLKSTQSLGRSAGSLV